MSLAGVHRLRGLLLLGLVANHRGTLWVVGGDPKGGSATTRKQKGVCDFKTEIPRLPMGFRCWFIYLSFFQGVVAWEVPLF